VIAVRATEEDFTNAIRAFLQRRIAEKRHELRIARGGADLPAIENRRHVVHARTQGSPKSAGITGSNQQL